MGTYTDAILLENQERLNDIETILYSDSSDSCFVKVLKHKLKKCSMLNIILSSYYDSHTHTIRGITFCFISQYSRSLRLLVSYALYSLETIPYNICDNRKPLQEQLVSLRRELALLAQKPNGYTAAEVDVIQEKVIN